MLPLTAANVAQRTPDEIAAAALIDTALAMIVARLLGRAFPGCLPDRLFQTDVRAFLGVLAQLRLNIFMSIVGLGAALRLAGGSHAG